VLSAVLFGFRYLPRLTGAPSLCISVGVSYFVLQAISYLADVYLGVLLPERRFRYLLLSLAFFPRLLQGPIERSGTLLPQLEAPYRFDYDNVRVGLLIFALGLFKKVAIASRLARYVDPVYADPSGHSSGTLLLATYAFALQVYFDFSGYTDMALARRDCSTSS